MAREDVSEESDVVTLMALRRTVGGGAFFVCLSCLLCLAMVDLLVLIRVIPTGWAKEIQSIPLADLPHLLSGYAIGKLDARTWCKNRWS
jgi:hypothetical protein